MRFILITIFNQIWYKQPRMIFVFSEQKFKFLKKYDFLFILMIFEVQFGKDFW